MKTIRLKLLMLMYVIGIILPLTSRADSFESCGIFYSVISDEDRTVRVTQSPNSYGDITIPQKVINSSKSYTVTKIGQFAFLNCRYLSSVKISSSVTAIGLSAFDNCSGLSSVDIPSSVTTIGQSAFRYCSNLSNVKIPSSVTRIEESTFRRCSSLSNVEIPNSVTTIGKSAFEGCSSLSSVEIPNSVTTIGESAFESCSSLSSVEIPNSVTTIGESAFESCCSLSSVEIPNSVTTIGSSAFSYCTGLSSVEIPNSVTTISGSAFEGCSSLTEINVQNGNFEYVSIDGILYEKENGNNEYEMIKCPGGKNGAVIIPESVTTIGRSAFSDCRNLTCLDIPSSVVSIMSNEFYGLEKIYCHWGEPVESESVFSSECLMNATLYVPIGTKAKYEKVDPWRNFWNIEEIDYESISGIKDVVGSDESTLEETDRFDVSGKHVSKDYKGLVIIRYSDGLTRKMLAQ